MLDIQHRTEKLHGNAGALSRLPCRQCGRIDQTSEVQAITRPQAKTKQNENIDQMDEPSVDMNKQLMNHGNKFGTMILS